MLVSHLNPARHHDEWFVALVQHSSDLMVVVDEQGSLLYVNPAAASMFGRFPEDTIGTNAFGYVHPEDVERLLAEHAKLVQAPGASVTNLVRFVSASGDVRVLEVVSTNCLDVPAVRGIVVNGRDVTERDEYMTRLQSSFDAITVALANTVELRDPYTAGHQREVATMAGAIARELGLPDGEVKGIEVAATLHDIGKVAVPAEILTKPGELSRAELEIVKTHPKAGADIVADVSFPWPVAEMILQHHERLDGSGYPDGLEADAILLGSQILAVADVVSAIAAHRPYRPARGVDAALAEIEVNQGRLYGRDAVGACLRLVREGRLHLGPLPTISPL